MGSASAAALATPAVAAASPASVASMGGATAVFTGHAAPAFAGRAGAHPSTAAALMMGGAASLMERPAATSTAGACPASDCAGVIPDEAILAWHEAMEFHLGGRHWLDLVPKKKTSSDLVCNRPSCDDSSA